jgi:hypothetical protein
MPTCSGAVVIFLRRDRLSKRISESIASGQRRCHCLGSKRPRRTAILLIGGDKTGDSRFYRRMIPVADRLYDEYIDELRKEGLIP